MRADVDVVDRKDRSRAYIRARAMIMKEQEGNESPLRSYVRTVQTFEKGDFVQMKTDSTAATPLLGRPRKWTQRWAEKGTVLGPVGADHPDQFWIRRSTTGRVRRSAATLAKTPSM